MCVELPCCPSDTTVTSTWIIWFKAVLDTSSQAAMTPLLHRHTVGTIRACRNNHSSYHITECHQLADLLGDSIKSIWFPVLLRISLIKNHWIYGQSCLKTTHIRNFSSTWPSQLIPAFKRAKRLWPEVGKTGAQVYIRAPRLGPNSLQDQNLWLTGSKSCCQEIHSHLQYKYIQNKTRSSWCHEIMAALLTSAWHQLQRAARITNSDVWCKWKIRLQWMNPAPCKAGEQSIEWFSHHG